MYTIEKGPHVYVVLIHQIKPMFASLSLFMMYLKRMPLIAIIALLCSCEKDVVEPAESPVSKQVKFTIAQGIDYSLPIYDGLKAEVTLSVAKESMLNGSVIPVWDTTFTLRSIRDYAVSTNPLMITKHVSGIVQSKEGLRVSRVIRYVTAENQISQDALGESVPPFITIKEVEVKL